MSAAADSVVSGGRRDNPARGETSAGSTTQSHWIWVLGLVGVDYFSTLAYQPSITYEVAGPLGPLATVVVVVVTMAGALPVYLYVAGRSPDGQGSIAVMERLIHGWRGKSLVLLLLGFAATDFIMTKTLSLADAAEHVIHNDYLHWQETLAFLGGLFRTATRELVGQGLVDYLDEQTVVAILLGILSFCFWGLIRRGFNRKAIMLSVAVVGVYLVLNAIILVSAMLFLVRHPDLLTTWYMAMLQTPRPWTGGFLLGGGYGMLVLFSVLLFPQLSLGLSGFEMGMVVMPQIAGNTNDNGQSERGRILNTYKLLVVAAIVMAIFLTAAVVVTTTLIGPEAFQAGGLARNRALAYLAHGGLLANGQPGSQIHAWFGGLFGSIYDLVTVVLLCLAGTSVVTSLRTLLPQFLLRFGMELPWFHSLGILFLLFAVVNLAVTLWFRASVEAQRGAYATGVLFLMSNACVATLLDHRRRHRRGWWRLLGGWLFVVTVGFTLSTVVLLYHNPSGMLIALGFILVIFGSSVASRAIRNRELRTPGFVFLDETSRLLWESMKYLEFPVLVPHRPGRRGRDAKEQSIRQEHQLAQDIDLVLIEVQVADASDFTQRPLLEIVREGNRFVLQISRCVSVAHAIAAAALELSKSAKPPALHFGWSEMSLWEASWSYLVFGEGNIPWKVRELILRTEPNPERRPRIIIG